MKSSVLLIYTGGTIGMHTDPESGALVPFDFTHIYEEIPSLRRQEVNIEVLPFEPIDSSNASPELWVRLAEKIAENYDKFDGFVVLHGTDTMSYSASALSFMLHNVAKPVVFTGSQIPIGVLRTDGRENLVTAIEFASAKDSKGRARVPGVSLYFQNRLFRGNRTTKQSAEELSAFASNNYPPLAEVGVSIQYNDPYISLTKAGAPFGIQTSLEELVTRVQTVGMGYTCTLTIGVLEGQWMGEEFTNLYRRFMDAYPNIDFRMGQGSFGALRERGAYL